MSLLIFETVAPHLWHLLVFAKLRRTSKDCTFLWYLQVWSTNCSHQRCRLATPMASALTEKFIVTVWCLPPRQMRQKFNLALEMEISERFLNCYWRPFLEQNLERFTLFMCLWKCEARVGGFLSTVPFNSARILFWRDCVQNRYSHFLFETYVYCQPKRT